MSQKTLQSKTTPHIDARVFRGLISVGDFPDIADAQDNWERYLQKDIELSNEEDLKIHRYLSDWHFGCQGNPDIAQIRHYFEKTDEVEVVDWLNEIAKALCFRREMYKGILLEVCKQNEEHRELFLLDCCRLITTMGWEPPRPFNGKKVLRGVVDSREWYESKTRESKISDNFDFKFITGPDIAKSAARPRVLLHHFGIHSGRPTAVIGYAGISKTWLAIFLALSTASGAGSCWGGLELARKGGVVHFDYEMGKDGISERYRRAAFGMNLDLSNLLGRKTSSSLAGTLQPRAFAAASAAHLDIPLQLLPLPKQDLHTRGMERALVRACRGKTLCIIDSFRAATASSPISENDSQIRKYLDMLARVSDETQCVFLVLHHARKDDRNAEKNDFLKIQDARGSSGIGDAFGATIHVENAENGFRLLQGKRSRGKRGEDVYLRLEDVGNILYEPDDFGRQHSVGSEGIQLSSSAATPGDLQLENDIAEITRIIRASGDHIDSKEDLEAVCKGIGHDRRVLAIGQMKMRGILRNTKKGYHLATTLGVEDMLHDGDIK